MLIHVAALAIGGKAKICVVQILDQDARACRCGNVRGLVTIIAACARVTAGQGEARLAVVYRFAVRLPANQRKIGAVMLGMTRNAVLTRCVRRDPHRVHALPLRDSLANLHMAIEAPKLHIPDAKHMALRAAQRA